ncbi:MAG: FG-GAP-like repeat-containing protein [Candidatus Sumerlaeota bacterium]|nr:FG-GAP-like repeat-containing protein [Candidatus Sumerlaeota bacterium]
MGTRFPAVSLAPRILPSGLRLISLLALVSASTGRPSGGDGALPNAGWWGAAQQNIRQMEYEATWQERSVIPGGQAAWHMANRAQNLRAYLEPDGVRVVRREEAEPSWVWRFSPRRFGRAGAMRALSPPSLAAEKNRVEYRRNELIERYENGESGIKYEAVLAQRPAGDGLLALEARIAGELAARPSANARSIDLLFHESLALQFGDLSAVDAAGRSLPAQVRLEGESLAMEIDDAGAAYPLVIHAAIAGAPAGSVQRNGLSTIPWIAMGDQETAAFGFSVATAGDVNGDGFSDVVVGAPLFDGGETDEGAAFVFLGGAAGPNTTPDWRAESNQADARLGWSVATAGDVNRDGYGDVLVGAPEYDSSAEDKGAVFLWLGSAAGLGASGDPTNADWTARGGQPGSCLGFSVAPAGDVNGDGHADIILGDYQYEDPEHGMGRVLVFHGSYAGPSSAPDWVAYSESTTLATGFGFSVATAGDVNGDGYADILVGAPGYFLTGRAFVWFGSISGLGETGAPGNADWEAICSQAEAWFGVTVATAGDVNGDGYAEVLVGANMYDNGEAEEGAAFLWQGSADGLGPDGTPANADWHAESNRADVQFGISVATAGDVNGDGYADVAIGAHYWNNGQPQEGATFVWHGSADGLGAAGTPENADWAMESNWLAARFGVSVGSAGDVNGDGYGDLIVGACTYTYHYTAEGGAAIFLGGPGSLNPVAGWGVAGGQENAMMGAAVASAGDVNGDGCADVVVGAPGFDGGTPDQGRAYVYYGNANGLLATPVTLSGDPQEGAQFGFAVASAGDVNGDGYDDVVIGQYLYDFMTYGDVGRVFVYYGSAAGIETASYWSAVGPATGGQFGFAVASAGDVDGDGYADILIGGPGYENGEAAEGGAWVYCGGPEGVKPGSRWDAESNKDNAMFGVSVGGAGDVNGDGFSDIIVGALNNANGETGEGRAYVYHGSVDGPSLAEDWRAESNQIGAQLGRSVGGAGDVNGDGYSDVIVGAWTYNGGGTDDGAAFVWHGSATGLGANGTPANADWHIEGGQDSAELGIAVGGAGDVNGDGFADVFAGAWRYTDDQTQEGRIYVHHGSAAGLSPVADWHGDGNQANAGLGYSAASAGDVNGDGYADLVGGAPGANLGHAGEGAAILSYGNGGRGLALRLRQMRCDQSAPIGRLGHAEADWFDLAIRGRTPFGRGWVKLEWEVKPLGTPFDGAPTGRDLVWSDTGTHGGPMDAAVGPLATDTPHHWRARLVYDAAVFPFQQRSRWLTAPWNGWQEQDLRTGLGRLGPSLTGVTDPGAGDARLAWHHDGPWPYQFLGFAWDIYFGEWVINGATSDLWFPFEAATRLGDMTLGFSGGYHAWISSQYSYIWLACNNPWTGIIYSGTPHTPVDVSVESRGGLNVRLHWRPEIYGTWHNQIIVYKVDDADPEKGDFVEVVGPAGNALWHFIDYGALAYPPGSANFLEGWADFTLPGPGSYWFLIRGASWLPPFDPPATGDYGMALIAVGG